MVIKKIFVIIPILIFFTACSNKNQNIESNNSQSEKTTLTYIEYKKLYEEKNKKIKNKPILEYETVITPKEYKTLMLNENSENVKSSSEIPKRKQAFNDFYNEWKNVRYKLGGESKKGIDCSAFTQRIYKDKFGIKLPRTTLTQVNMGVEVKKAELIPGDLVFFKTSKTDKHVGVYVGNGNFMHASIKGIQFTSLDKPFYKKNYWTSRRIID
ncbi:peptidase P60 [Arcobacter defluvii]|nr:peptidase P60 [Arcobacter defluvii]